MVEVVQYQKGNKVYHSIPKFKLISSHTGRRTFITNSILAGIPLPIIQGITGHKKLSTVQKYIKTSEKDSSIEMMKLASYFS
jgi:integrase